MGSNQQSILLILYTPCSTASKQHPQQANNTFANLPPSLIFCLRAASCALMADGSMDPTFFNHTRPIVIASQDSVEGLEPMQVAPTVTFSATGASSSDAIRARTLAIVPRQSNPPRRTAHGTHSATHRPRFGASPPSMADEFSQQYTASTHFCISLRTVSATCCAA